MQSLDIGRQRTGQVVPPALRIDPSPSLTHPFTRTVVYPSAQVRAMRVILRWAWSFPLALVLLEAGHQIPLEDLRHHLPRNAVSETNHKNLSLADEVFCIITLGIHLSGLRMLEAAIQEEYDTHRTTRAEINGLTVYCPIAQAFLSLSVYISRRKRRSREHDEFAHGRGACSSWSEGGRGRRRRQMCLLLRSQAKVAAIRQ